MFDEDGSGTIEYAEIAVVVHSISAWLTYGGGHFPHRYSELNMKLRDTAKTSVTAAVSNMAPLTKGKEGSEQAAAYTATRIQMKAGRNDDRSPSASRAKPSQGGGVGSVPFIPPPPPGSSPGGY